MRAPALVVVLLALTSALGGCSERGSKAAETAPASAPVPVEVAAVTTVTVERTADLVGSFFANEEVTVASQLEARIGWLGPDMGDRVQAGQEILTLDDADVQAQLREVEAKLVKARADNARAEALRREGIMSSGEAERMGTDAAVLDAQRDYLKVQLDRAHIRSPLTGAVAARLVSIGEVVKRGDPVYRIVQDDPLKFRTPVPERFARFLHLGQEVRLGVAPYPELLFVGRITRINPTSEAANRSITVEAEVPNAEALLKPGYFGSGRIVYDDSAQALAVPERALTTFAGVTKVFVVKDGTAEERVVRTGDAVRDSREILEGVHEGEQVAVTNVERLENGASITVTGGEPVARSQP